MYGLHFREELPEPVQRELDALIAKLKAFLLLEHNEDGSHNFDLSQVEQSTIDAIIDRYQQNGQWWKTGPWIFDDPPLNPHKAGLRPANPAAGTYNDYNPPGMDTAVILEIEPDGDITLTGLKALDGANRKRLLMLRNRDSGNSITLAHEDTGSTEQYRFDMPESTDVTLDPGQNVWLYYDPGRERWTAAITGQAAGAIISPGVDSGGFPSASSFWTTVHATSTVDRNSGTARAADPTIKVTMSANTTYIIRMLMIFYAEAGGPSLVYRLTGPASPTNVHMMRRTGQTGSVGGERMQAYSSGDITVAFNTDADTGTHEHIFVWVDAVIENGANAGDFNFEWTSSNATWEAFRVKGSYVEYKAL